MVLAVPVLLFNTVLNAGALYFVLHDEFQYYWYEALAIGTLVTITDPVDVVH